MKRFFIISLFCFIFIINVNRVLLQLLNDDMVIVEVEQGKLSGTDYVTSTGRTVFAFYGIPYAAKPVNDYRFKEPQPLKPWAGIWNASVLSSSCFQISEETLEVIGGDDCLYMNIFTPKLPTREANPLFNVIVNIHGGGYVVGSGNDYYPDYLLKSNDLVMVTFNYRLGPMGFLSVGDEIIPGNNGLKDQVAALKWINNNIIKFGGDPSRITLYGLSAGASSVFMHYLSPLSNGLFTKGISSSPAIYPTFAKSELMVNNSKTLASLLGCPVDNSKELVKCMQRRPGKQIMEMTKLFLKWEMFPFSQFRPVIEPEHRGAFLDKNPAWLIRNGKVSNKPWLFGLVDHEGLFPMAYMINRDDLLKQLEENWEELIPYVMHIDPIPDKEQSVNIANRLKSFYLQNKTLSMNVIKELIQMAGDRYFYVVTRQIAAAYSSVVSSPVFCYKFGYRGNFSFSSYFTRDNENYGVSHADDVQYIFKLEHPSLSEEDMINLMTDIVVSFANYGKPATPNNADWFPITKNSKDINCLHITASNQMWMGSINDAAADDFWTSLLDDELNYSRAEPHREREEL